MGRHRTGPRTSSKGGMLMAILKTKDGRFLKESLRTRDMKLAWDLYPAAMLRLQAKAKGVYVPPQPVIKPTDQAVVWEPGPGSDINNPDTWVQRITEARKLYEPEQFTITWEQALQLHLQRREEKTGRPSAQSSIRSMKKALEPLAATSPGELDVPGVHSYIAGLKANGDSPVTRRQRCSLVKAILETLVLQGHLEQNVLKRVDFSATSSNHIPTATPEELKALFKAGDPAVIALAFTGMRVSELVSRRKEHLKDGWLEICPVGTYRPKNDQSHRRVPLPDWLELELPSPSRSAIRRSVVKACPRISPHSLRHSFKTAARDALIPTELSEALIGHSHQGMVGVYGQFSDTALRAAAEKTWAVLMEWVKG